MQKQDTFGNLPPNLNHRERMSLNPNLDLYVIAVALTAIFLNFSNDFLPFIMRIPAIILALVIIAAVLCSISIAKYIKIRTISLSKNCEKTNVNTLIIGRNTEMSGIEVIPVEIEAMTLREQNLFKSSLSKIWSRMPDDLILISMNFNNVEIPVKNENSAVESYSSMLRNLMGNTFYFRHFILIRNAKGIERKGKLQSDLDTVQEQLASIGMKFKQMDTSLLEKLWGEFP